MKKNLYLISPCTRTKNLLKVKKNINFNKIKQWIIVYNTEFVEKKKYFQDDRNVVELYHKDIGSICTYIYWNNYRKDWDQKKFFEFSKILNQRLPLYPKNELVNLNSSKNKKINLAFFSADIRSRHPVTFFLKTVLPPE